MPGPLVLVPALLTAGGVIWEWLRPEKDPEWGDKDVFNDRMRQLQTSILNLNSTLAACPEFMKNQAQLAAWRNFRTNWSKYYKDVGTLSYLGPNDAQIANGKLYASQLAKWIDVLKNTPSCSGVSKPAPSSMLGGPQIPPNSDIFDWKTLLTIGGSLGGAFLVWKLFKR